MPELKEYSPPIEVAKPAGRRVWSNPDIQSHSLLVLTLDGLHLAPLTGPPREEAVAAAEAGADLDELLGPFATAIELASVSRVKLDLLSNSLAIEYSRGHAKSQIILTFASPESADTCFSRIWRRLGEGCQLHRQRDSWAQARTPLMLLAVILAATALLALGITVLDDLAPARAAASVNVPGDERLGGPVQLPRALHSLIGWMDWRAVCALGGVAAAATQVWLYRRLTQPPAELEVIRA
jgi:hypothetical protein